MKKEKKPKEKKVKKRDGRNPIEIDWVQVQLYARAGCTGKEIAAAIGMHHDHFYRVVQKQWGEPWVKWGEKYDEIGKAELRLAQHKKAVEKLNTIMLIWMGKQRLNQYDRAALNVTQNDICLENLTLEQLKALQNNPTIDLNVLNTLSDTEKEILETEAIEHVEFAAAISNRD